ncbi:hypothetical protein GCM10010503_41210 [Streptomyces lucensis JCM 4490]|uniref:Uncharacterized protein n=1 Tax=Streptomyces lucensis JCM 4490 TaxID=1306176 RepID=A0A918JBY0_9ACTN|nr:hypothetical protein [Streptomyces lucensis]GGW59756.1 hypothetical protein GCM10010503_41210 [Streptomyces lucensis JCM 4490]
MLSSVPAPGNPQVSQPSASPLPLGEPLLVGEALVLPEGLAEGLVEGVAVRDGELGRRLADGRGVGLRFAGGAALVLATEGREAGDWLRGTVG